MNRAFTLIEVLLALALASVVLLIVGFAVETHFRLLDVSRTEVEESQLARALLEKIARDIRSVVVAQQKENLQVDTSLFDAMLMGDTFGAETASLEAALSSESGSAESESETAVAELPEDGTVVGTTPGIYGSFDWIQIDTGRLPRGETFKTNRVLAEGTLLGDRVSPTKTALYFLGEDTGMLSAEESTEEKMGGSLGASTDRYAYRYGLFRRQLDRNVSEYAVENALESEYEQYDEPLAPEVESIEFLYYDPANQEWIDYWDMDELGSLPGAVRIILHLRRKTTPPSAFSGMFGNSQQEIPTIVYSTVVPMPLSYVPPEPATTEETEADLL